MMQTRTYLDYNATAPLRGDVRDAMLLALDVVGNPSSVHAEGRKARAIVEAARGEVARLIGARPADVVFTSGASEANATVLAGGWQTIFISALEHDSVRLSAKRSGARVVEVPIASDGTFDVSAFAALAGSMSASAPALVCLQLANNETGVIQPVAELAAIARARGIRIHCDAVQAPGRLTVDCGELGVDYLTVSAHKLGGPKGAGALASVDGAPLPALIVGGGQERGRRSGTENVAAIAGFGVAARLALLDLEDCGRVAALRDTLERDVAAVTPAAVIVGANATRMANTSCIALPGLASETVVIRMDLAGIAVSAGAACSSGKVGQSAVLSAMNLDPLLARAAIRVSLGHGSTEADVAAFVATWTSAAAAIRRAA